MCFVFSITNTIQPLLVILYQFLNYCMGFLQAPKKLPQKRYFGWGACYQHTAQTAQFWAIEIISGANRHPSDVPFVCKF